MIVCYSKTNSNFIAKLCKLRPQNVGSVVNSGILDSSEELEELDAVAAQKRSYVYQFLLPG